MRGRWAETGGCAPEKAASAVNAEGAAQAARAGPALPCTCPGSLAGKRASLALGQPRPPPFSELPHPVHPLPHRGRPWPKGRLAPGWPGTGGFLLLPAARRPSSWFLFIACVSVAAVLEHKRGGGFRRHSGPDEIKSVTPAVLTVRGNGAGAGAGGRRWAVAPCNAVGAETNLLPGCLTREPPA